MQPRYDDGLLKFSDILNAIRLTKHAKERIKERYPSTLNKCLRKISYFILVGKPSRAIHNGQKYYLIKSKNYKFVFTYKEMKFTIITFMEINKNIEST